VLASITKGGLAAATRSLAIEYGARGMRVNAVAPGLITTPLNPPSMRETLAPLPPIGRVGQIEDIAQAVLYLEEAPLVTSETLHVDGGMVAGH
jgi:NAD(P)-dependent dehydrogenase (short-subunit alcohol dehydrogenase family)